MFLPLNNNDDCTYNSYLQVLHYFGLLPSDYEKRVQNYIKYMDLRCTLASIHNHDEQMCEQFESKLVDSGAGDIGFNDKDQVEFNKYIFEEGIKYCDQYATRNAGIGSIARMAELMESEAYVEDTRPTKPYIHSRRKISDPRFELKVWLW